MCIEKEFNIKEEQRGKPMKGNNILERYRESMKMSLKNGNKVRKRNSRMNVP